MPRILFISAAVSGLILASCGNKTETAQTKPVAEQSNIPPVVAPTAPTQTPVKMMAQSFSVKNASGLEIGTVQINDTASGVDIKLDVTAMPEGDHAFHFHENGTCDGPDFTTAGGHYNPQSAMHGFGSETGPHAGDMRNFDAPMSGIVKTTLENSRVSLSDRSGYAPLFDANGTALIIHAEADDYKSQPSGAAGARIACAVISK